MANEGEIETVTLTDEEMVVQFCTQNKVSKTATDELLKRGFTSLEALKLVELDDLSSEKIPRGQRRLIMHIVTTLFQEGTAVENEAGTADSSEPAATPTGTASSQPGAGTSTLVPVTITQEMETPSDNAVQNDAGVTNKDLYTNLISQMLTQQKTIQSNQTLNSDSAPAPQPSWNDPQVHISTAAGKSVSQYLDICDFVQNTLTHEDDVILGGQGDQQIVVKSGPKKPRLESLTLSQWSVANLAILYKLVNDNKLSGAALMDYLSYSTKVYQLVQRFSLVSVLLYDREYRKLQSSMGFRWGTDVQHLHTLFLQARDKPSAQGNLPKKGMSTAQPGGKFNKDKAKEKPICRNFNAQKGCSFPNCSYRHVCMLPGCSERHSAQDHVGKN